MYIFIISKGLNNLHQYFFLLQERPKGQDCANTLIGKSSTPPPDPPTTKKYSREDRENMNSEYHKDWSVQTQLNILRLYLPP